MTIKGLILSAFGEELRISGGDGSSVSQAIIIHRDPINDYVATEYLILKCLTKHRGKNWKTLSQTLHNYDGTIVDEIQIEVWDMDQKALSVQKEIYYFDITESFG